MSNVLKASEDLLKTPEQLEEDKRHILSNRIPKMSLDGKGKESLIRTVNFKVIKSIFVWLIKKILKVQDFYAKLIDVTSYFYDLGERIQAQKYEVNFWLFLKSKTK